MLRKSDNDNSRRVQKVWRMSQSWLKSRESATLIAAVPEREILHMGVTLFRRLLFRFFFSFFLFFPLTSPGKVLIRPPKAPAMGVHVQFFVLRVLFFYGFCLTLNIHDHLEMSWHSMKFSSSQKPDEIP